MILTVTLNAALDITYRVPHLRPAASHRVSEVSERPGGKGLNVARVLASLGHCAVVTGFVGGRTGEKLRELLAADAVLGPPADPPPESAPEGSVPEGSAHGAAFGTFPGGSAFGGPAFEGSADRSLAAVPPQRLPGGAPGTAPSPDGHRRHGRLLDALTLIEGTTRRTVGVVDAGSGETTQLNEPGPTIGRAEWDAFLHTYTALLGEATAVALCGSLPPGLPVGSYARLVRDAQAAGVPVLLDTSGEPLRRGIAARPDLVKPNTDELAGLTGSTEPIRAALDARRRGARAVVASLGSDGMFAATADGSWQAAPPRRFAGNPTGAGDSAVAGLLSGLVEGLAWPDRLARAVALSAATVQAPVAGEFDHTTYEDLLPQVEVLDRSDVPV
ncbi:1-phosphofructokinase family hexose kinase [Streptomyces sp. NPDC047108]|uniref:1-phosphofructokinase family hexose kinase n=1 Tax=Streptomyces sp. NPDC047108 TaxID=3155025 RepID=UPI0033D94E83